MDFEINNSFFTKENELSRSTHFPCHVYSIQKLEFLPNVLKVAEDYLSASKLTQKLDDIYPVIMTDNLVNDMRMETFLSYVGNTAWNILNSEGYDMDKYNVRFSEVWVQEHHKHSLMETHIHGMGSQISGFYFLETPENCSRVIIHDPRQGKMQVNLPQKNRDNATDASEMINFLPVPGMLMFMPSWLPHSFGRQASDKPLKFVHFNLYPEFKPQPAGTCGVSQVEIV